MITLIFQYSILSQISRANYATVVLVNYNSCVNLLLVSFRNLSSICHAVLPRVTSEGDFESPKSYNSVFVTTNYSQFYWRSFKNEFGVRRNEDEHFP